MSPLPPPVPAASATSVTGSGQQLIDAALSDDAGAITQLLNGGADVNFQDQNGLSALAIACGYNNENIVTQLVNASANCNVQYNGVPALIIALMNDNTNIAAKLVDGGANYNVADNIGTPLIYACIFKNESMAVKLLDLGASCNIARADGVVVSPLMWAYGNDNIVKALLKVPGLDTSLVERNELILTSRQKIQAMKDSMPPKFQEVMDVGIDYRADGAEHAVFAAKPGKEAEFRHIMNRTDPSLAGVLLRDSLVRSADNSIFDKRGCVTSGLPFDTLVTKFKETQIIRLANISRSNVSSLSASRQTPLASALSRSSSSNAVNSNNANISLG